MDVTEAVGLVLHATTLEFGNGLGDVHGNGAGLRVRHQTTGSEHAAQTTDLTHEVRRSDSDVEVQESTGHLGYEILGTDNVGSGVTSSLGGFTGGEYGHAIGLTSSGGQRQGAANDLVGLTRVDAEAAGDLDGLVELGGSSHLHLGHGLGKGE